MNKESKIFVAGHKGMVGSAIVRELEKQGYNNIITRTHTELDLINQESVNKFFKEEQPEYVFLSAAKVGGIIANDLYSADFMYENIMIEMNVIHAAFMNNCKKVEFLGSACIYPKITQQPIKEEYLLTGKLEQSNEAYALAKISGLKYCEYLNKQYGTKYISLMPTNLYGINDSYNVENSHVLPALIMKFHNAKIHNLQSVTCWGDGTPTRDFLFVDDLARICILLMNNYDDTETINAASGKAITIKELADTVANVIGFTGEIKWDITKPNGTPERNMDITKLKDIGYQVETDLKTGIEIAYNDYKKRFNFK